MEGKYSDPSELLSLSIPNEDLLEEVSFIPPSTNHQRQHTFQNATPYIITLFRLPNPAPNTVLAEIQQAFRNPDILSSHWLILGSLNLKRIPAPASQIRDHLSSLWQILGLGTLATILALNSQRSRNRNHLSSIWLIVGSPDLRLILAPSQNRGRLSWLSQILGSSNLTMIPAQVSSTSRNRDTLPSL